MNHPPVQPTITGLFSCKKCNNQMFDQRLLIGTVSALTTPSGKEEYVMMPTIVCEQCGMAYNPQDMSPFGEMENPEAQQQSVPDPKSNIILMKK